MSAPLQVLVNGGVGAPLSPFDRGLHFGDGLFETIHCANGQPCWWPLHWQRMQRGAERLGLQLPAPEQLKAEVVELALHAERCLVKLIVTRGEAVARGYAPIGRESGTRIALRYDWPAPPPPLFRARLAKMTLGENPWLAGIKHLNRLEQVLAQREMVAAGCDEVLLRAGSGRVVCGSMSNLFIATGDGLVTPDLELCGVEGVMRAMVLQACAALRLPVRVAAISTENLATAISVFVTNVRLGAQPVHSLDGRSLAIDPRIAQLQRWIDDHAF